MMLLKDSVFRNVSDLCNWEVFNVVQDEVRDSVYRSVYFEIYAEIQDELYTAIRAPLYYNVFNYVKRKIDTL